MKRQFGILCPIFALDGEYGTGTFGKESFKFIDFLELSGAKVWQVLPLGQTTYGDSPYQTTSDISFNAYFTDLEDLAGRGYITKTELLSARRRSGRIDYGKLYKDRNALLRKAFSRFDYPDDFFDFINRKENRTAAEFAALKDLYGSLENFPAELKRREKKALRKFRDENAENVLFHGFSQYILNLQYAKLKNYAAEKGISIMGDLPLYVAYDSAEVWENPELFKLDEDMRPSFVAGVPPDYFSEDGQLWGNPVYDYKEMEKDGFRWWKNRLKTALKRFDLLRIDHFRGLDRYWEIPYGKSAKEGSWEPSSGREILKRLPNKRLIAEDLGVIDDGVKNLLAETGLSGMKVLLFAFDGNADNPYLPKNVGKKSVVYVGTHDNATVAGYAKSLNKNELRELKKNINEILPDGEKVKKKSDLPRAFIETALSTKAELAILTPQDIYGLDDAYRINVPSTVGNWTARFPKRLFTAESAEALRALAKKYSRV